MREDDDLCAGCGMTDEECECALSCSAPATGSVPNFLRGVADELVGLIAEINDIKQKAVGPFDEQPPDFHDYQTCSELYELAKAMEQNDLNQGRENETTK